MSAQGRHAPPRQALDFYAQPAAMTAMGNRARLFGELPGDVAALSPVLQGLQIHEYMAAAYSVRDPRSAPRRVDLAPSARCWSASSPSMTGRSPSPDRRSGDWSASADTSHCCSSPCCAPAGITARARVGSSELISCPASSWITGCANGGTSGRRAGSERHAVDAALFGIRQLRGAWFIAGNLIRDVAALNKVELLRPHFRCVWRHTTPTGPALPMVVVPDGCVDLLWHDGGLFVVGPDVERRGRRCRRARR